MIDLEQKSILTKKIAKCAFAILLFMDLNGCGHVPVNKQKAAEICDKQFKQGDYGNRKMYSLVITDKPDPSRWTCFFTGFDMYSPNYHVIIELTKEDGQITVAPGK